MKITYWSDYACPYCYIGEARMKKALEEIAENENVNVEIEMKAFQLDPSAGDMLTVSGQIRSHNHRTETARHLLIFVFATALEAACAEPMNDCILEGTLCREPIYRRTPLGREICDVMLAVPRAFRRADYLPCILWGRTAQEISTCHVRDRIRICGRLQSRGYTKLTDTGPQDRTAYEISALTAEIME